MTTDCVHVSVYVDECGVPAHGVYVLQKKNKKKCVLYKSYALLLLGSGAYSFHFSVLASTILAFTNTHSKQSAYKTT